MRANKTGELTLIFKTNNSNMKCRICGTEEIPSDYSNQKEMEEHEMCFSCNFWRDMLEKDAKRPPHTWCVIDGTHYVIEPDEPNAAFQGFGGDEFNIRFNDGTVVKTHNLWCQGEPGEHWRDKFPDNATFEWQWKEINGNKYLIPKYDI